MMKHGVCVHPVIDLELVFVSSCAGMFYPNISLTASFKMAGVNGFRKNGKRFSPASISR